jgi:hypothetical protein
VDGYLLAIQRIAAVAAPATKGPAFLYHGIMEVVPELYISSPCSSRASFNRSCHSSEIAASELTTGFRFQLVAAGLLGPQDSWLKNVAG